MLVYGDRHEIADPSQRVAEINRRLSTLKTMPSGIERHARLVGALIEAGKLLQGLADADFETRGFDRRTTSTDGLNECLLQLGRAVCRSWDNRFHEMGDLPRLEASPEWPTNVELRVPEGFAFYAVYPEAYAEAARRLKLVAPARVIGLRSIGTSLAAIVAAALEAQAPVTVRPCGDPWRRTIVVDADLERELLRREAHYVIVDEGPGQSGSSFGAVANWLEARGVPLDRIAIVPSHSSPPGSQSTDERRRWWNEVQREVGDFGDRWPGLIACWSAQALGTLDEEPRDISGGAWRCLQDSTEDSRPAVVPAWERRKFVVGANGERFLVKFAGLGRVGEEKFAIARALHSERLVPEPVALIHGFMIEHWSEGASPLARDSKPLREIARYIGTRARLLPATSESGASIDELRAMIRRNLSLEFGDGMLRATESLLPRAGEMQARVVRVRTDNKLDAHEWLRSASGDLIKTDALDHHQAHDLIGCQDLAWDVAGTIVEFDVDQDTTSHFIAWVEHWAGRDVDRELLDFDRLAYLAFRLGQARLGQAMVSDSSEKRRLVSRGDRYAAELQHLLESTRAATRPESLVG